MGNGNEWRSNARRMKMRLWKKMKMQKNLYVKEYDHEKTNKKENISNESLYERREMANDVATWNRMKK